MESGVTDGLSKSERKSALYGAIAAGISVFLIFLAFNGVIPLLYTQKTYGGIEIVHLAGISEEEAQMLGQEAETRIAEKKNARKESAVAAKKGIAPEKQRSPKTETEAVSVLSEEVAEVAQAAGEGTVDFYDQFAPNFLPYDSTSSADEQKSEILKAAEIRLAEEEARRMEEWRIEQERLNAEREKAEQARREEQARLAEERRQAAERRLAEEQRKAAEQKRIAAEQKRIAEEQRKAAEQKRIAEEQRKVAEQKRIAEEQRKAAEQKRIAEEQRKAAEQKRIAEEQRKAAEQKRIAEEQRKAAEQKRIAEEQRKAAEQKRIAEEQRKAAEQKRIAEEQRKAAEQKRIAEEQRKAAEQKRIAEEQRKAAEQKRIAEEQRKAAEQKRIAEEQRKAAEQKRIAEEQRKAAEQKRIAEEQRKAAEQKRIAEAQKRSSGSVGAMGGSGGMRSSSNLRKAETTVKIYGTAYSQQANGVSSTSQVKTERSASGTVLVRMTDGSMRELLSPKEPVLVLSAEAAALIKASKRVVVSFSVNAAGTVVPDSMRTTPSSLPYQIDEEVKKQLDAWRFARSQRGGAVSFIFTLEND